MARFWLFRTRDQSLCCGADSESENLVCSRSVTVLFATSRLAR